MFAFLQFTEANISDATKAEWRDKEKVKIMDIFPTSIYGELALQMNILILVGAVYILLTQDKPLTIKRVRKSFKQGYNFVSDSFHHREFHSLAKIAIVIIIMVIFFDLTRSLISSPVENSYRAGKGMFIVWVIISPILILSALLVSLDIVAKDYPKLMNGYNIRNTSFFIVCVIIALALLGIISTVFNITSININLNAEHNPFPGLEGVFYFENGLWGIIGGTIGMLIAIFLLITIEIIIWIRFGSNEIRERRKANFLFLFPFIMMYVYLKTFSATFFFGLHLKSLTNIIDILSILIVMFLSIFRVLSIQEASETQDFEGKDWFNPKKWSKLIPPYSKMLFLFYLAFASFYATLEANTIITLNEKYTEFKFVQMVIYLSCTLIAIFFVFKRYKPFGGIKSPGSNRRENQPSSVSK